MTFRPPRGSVNRKTLLKYLSKPCSYERYNCTRPCLDDYSFCVRHILENKNAPFKQCNYIYTVTGRRCPLPAPKNDRRDSYCAEHLRKMQVRLIKECETPQPPLTTERLLSSISHYIKNPDGNKNQGIKNDTSEKMNENTSSAVETTSDVSDREMNAYTKCLNPFVDINASNVNDSLHKVLEYCSESDSDVDVTTVDHTSRLKDEDSSDAESIDSLGEDPFKYANVYTLEEISMITKEKLIRLQSLYLEQFKRLRHILKEKRRDYIHALQREKETLCSIANQPRNSIKEQNLYEKLKSLNHYHKRFGVEAILHKKSLEKRAAVTENLTNKTSSTSKCIFTEGGVKCSLKTLPCSKYCNKHILEDPNQILFRPCSVNNGVSTCQEPVLHIFPNENCVFHLNLPPAQLTYNTNLSSEEEQETATKIEENTESNEVNDVKPIKTDDLNVQDFRIIEKNEELPMDILEEKEMDTLDVLEEKDINTLDALEEKEINTLHTLEEKEINTLHTLEEKEINSLDVLEEKEVAAMNLIPIRPDTESDHMYYMSEDCLSRQVISTEECIVPFDSEESEELLIDTTNNMEIN